jgi:hypothetical protein
MSDLSEDSVDHFKVSYPDIADLTCNVMALLESDSKGDQEVFMEGQGDSPVEQTEEEISWAAEAEITRLDR